MCSSCPRTAYPAGRILQDRGVTVHTTQSRVHAPSWWALQVKPPSSPPCHPGCMLQQPAAPRSHTHTTHKSPSPTPVITAQHSTRCSAPQPAGLPGATRCPPWQRPALWWGGGTASRCLPAAVGALGAVVAVGLRRLLRRWAAWRRLSGWTAGRPAPVCVCQMGEGGGDGRYRRCQGRSSACCRRIQQAALRGCLVGAAQSDQYVPSFSLDIQSVLQPQPHVHMPARHSCHT
jgi:hypothetical protein